MLSDLSGIPKEEVLWNWNRMKELHAEGMTREAVIEKLKEESIQKPWEAR